MREDLAWSGIFCQYKLLPGKKWTRSIFCAILVMLN